MRTTLHSLRHTFATVGVEAGVPEEVMGRLLNHASKTITGQRYVKPKLDFLRSAMAMVVEELAKRLGPAPLGELMVTRNVSVRFGFQLPTNLASADRYLFGQNLNRWNHL